MKNGHDGITAVLINPGSNDFVSSMNSMPKENLGIARLAAYLRHNLNIGTVIIDQATFQLSNKAVCDEILKLKPGFVGFSPVAQNIGNAIEIGINVRRLLPEVYIAMGGHHASLAAAEIIGSELWLDAIAMGYAEPAMKPLMEAILGKCLFEEVPGLCWRKNGGAVTNPAVPWIDINKLPLPDHDVLNHFIAQEKHLIAACSINTAIGCPFNCSYCTTPCFMRLHPQAHWQALSVGKVMEEIAKIKKIGVKFFWFADDNHFATKEAIERAEAIARQLIQGGTNVKYGILARADTLLAHQDSLDLMIESGLCRISVGFEAMDDATLGQYDKTTDVQQNLAIYGLARKKKLYLHITFINLHPWTSFESLRRNLNGLIEVEGASFGNLSSCLQLFPGTPVVERLRRENLLRGYNYKSSPYAYAFNDPRIGQLAETLAGMRSDAKFADAWKCDSLILDLGLFFAIQGQNQQEFQGLRSRAYSTNASAFSEMLKLAEDGWDEEGSQEIKKEYIKASKSNLLELKKMHKACMEINMA